MPPNNVRQTPPTNVFSKDIQTAIVLFKADGGRDHDHRNDMASGEGTQRIRTSFQVVYKPLVVSFRFQTHVFSKGPGGRETKMSLYFDLPSHYVSSLAYTDSVDTVLTPELGQHAFGGAATRLRFRLRRPGRFVTSLREDYNLKASSQRVFDSMAALVTTPEFALFVPRNLFTKHQLNSLQEAVASWTTSTRRQAENEAHSHWLGSLYGNAGGRVAAGCESAFSIAAARAPGPPNSPEGTTASESGESTIATPTPPAYRKSTTSAEEGAAGLNHMTALLATEDIPAVPASLPPYDLTQSEETDKYNDSSDVGRGGPSERSEGKRAAKRVRHDSEETTYGRFGRRRSGTPSADREDALVRGTADDFTRFLVNPSAAGDGVLSSSWEVLLMKVDQMLGRNQELECENKALQAQLAMVMSRTQSLEEKQARLAQSHEELEVNHVHLCKRHERLEGRHEELLVRQWRLDDRCDTIDADIEGQVRSALRETLLSPLAVQRMD